MKAKLIFLLLASCFLLLTSHVYAFVATSTDCNNAPIGQAGHKNNSFCEDIKNTRHNLSAVGPGGVAGAAGRNVFTTQTTEICVFCHTPHGANPDALIFGAPIWNRRLSAETYTMYDQVWSKSFEGVLNTGQPTGFSRLCLSCHDGTIALSRILNPPGSGGFEPITNTGSTVQSFSMTYPTAQTSGPACPAGVDCIPKGVQQTTPGGQTILAEQTGDTRLLGTDLTNDHAISFIFDSVLAGKDRELVDPGAPIALHTAPGVALTTPGIDPNLAPVKRHVGTGPNTADSVQCTSCHNPHQRDYPKFLRANRLQLDQGAGPCPPSCNPPTARPAPGALPDTAIICLFCHDKPGVPYGGISLSTHFTDPTKINLTDNTKLTTDLMFTTAQPLSSVINQTPATVAVAQRACLACHDPHTEAGAIRLLRQGADNSVNPPDVAIEQTCYQCHSPTNKTFNTIDATDCPPAGGNFPDCPPDVFTQFQKDNGTAGEASDPPFSAPEFGEAANPLTPLGSAMNLRLGLGHQPVFTRLPSEGVQMNSDNPVASTFGGPLTIPANNKATPENAPYVNDTKHIECVDCHNMHRVDRTNRFRGMPGITIGTGAFGSILDTTGGSTLIVADTLDKNYAPDVQREPFIFEVCLRCHGNTFNSHIGEQRVTANGSGLTVQLRGNNSGQAIMVPSFTYAGANPTSTTLGGGSNKRKEFDPNSKPFYNSSPYNSSLATTARLVTQTPPNNGLPGFNTSFHPVAAPGRNQSGVLNNINDAVPGQFRGQLSRKKTIHCTDCHNSDLFGTYAGGLSQPTNSNGNTGSISIPDFPGPITFDETRGTAYKRGPTNVFSWAPDYEGDLGQNPNIPVVPAGSLAALNNPNTPQGPHGSQWRRILRSNYNTRLSTNENTDLGDGYNSQNFALCFNCHNEAAFITQSWPTGSQRLTNFYRQDTGNLHWLHLVDRTNARCHECHNNVHSNIESGNTLYVDIKGTQNFADCSAGIGACNPGHQNSTHLINFAPEIARNVYNNPVWGNGYFVNGNGSTNRDDPTHNGPGCNLRCHGFDMKHNYDAHSVENGGKCVENLIPGSPMTCQ